MQAEAFGDKYTSDTPSCLYTAVAKKTGCATFFMTDAETAACKATGRVYKSASADPRKKVSNLNHFASGVYHFTHRLHPDAARTTE